MGDGPDLVSLLHRWGLSLLVDMRRRMHPIMPQGKLSGSI